MLFNKIYIGYIVIILIGVCEIFGRRIRRRIFFRKKFNIDYYEWFNYFLYLFLLLFF